MRSAPDRRAQERLQHGCPEWPGSLGPHGVAALVAGLLTLLGLSRRGRASRFTLFSLFAAAGAVIGGGSNLACQGSKIGDNDGRGDAAKSLLQHHRRDRPLPERSGPRRQDLHRGL